MTLGGGAGGTVLEKDSSLDNIILQIKLKYKNNDYKNGIKEFIRTLFC